MRFTAAHLESHAVYKTETAIDGDGTEPAPGAHLCDLLHSHGVCRPLGGVVLILGVCHLRLRFGKGVVPRSQELTGTTARAETRHTGNGNGLDAGKLRGKSRHGTVIMTLDLVPSGHLQNQVTGNRPGAPVLPPAGTAAQAPPCPAEVYSNP